MNNVTAPSPDAELLVLCAEMKAVEADMERMGVLGKDYTKAMGRRWDRLRAKITATPARTVPGLAAMAGIATTWFDQDAEGVEIEDPEWRYLRATLRDAVALAHPA